ncbi:sporulation transcription factor [Thermoclostridium stercorarium subsp. thermolacticum DSM 2910]|uniref:Stage 0 sporulation protein A homolog n=1 Tax=Thermoclostridium stercorarium subsp. thermolacticum DSM 2910 TaxID=1121336 RepID=A0A1B1YF33_THEST|nr:sporulation transcription factor [Thermoclostridium stercorarium subsp. thermolacticum DSM 2910]
MRIVNKEIDIIIVDNNEEYALEVEKSLKTVPAFRIVGKVYDGETAVKKIIEHKPDVIILDLVMPVKDGIAVLEEIRTISFEPKPVIIVLTAIGNEKIIKKALSLGADYYIIKPFDMDLLPKRIMQIYGDFERAERQYREYGKTVKLPNFESEKNESDETEKNTVREDLELYVRRVLMELGVPAHLSGYGYLQMAIVENSLCERGTIPITKQLYPMIAEAFNTSAGRVERAIRNAIRKVWQEGNRNELSKYFIYSEKRKNHPPTNSEFISTIADKIKLTYLSK